MAASLTVGDLLKCQVWTADLEQAAVNTVYYRVLTITGTPDTDDVAVDFNTAMKAVYPVLLSDTAGYLGVQVTDITALPLQSPSNFSDPVVGTGGTIGAPRQSAPLLRFVTGFAGPKGRGRLYIPFMPAAGLATAGFASTAYLADMVLMMNALSGFTSFSVGGNSGTLEQVLFHRITKTGTKIITWSTTNKIATQKRRGSFGRANVSPV